MKYTVKTTSQFRRDYRRAMRDGLDMGPLDGLIAALSEGDALPGESRDRPLGGKWAGHRACRVSPGRMLIYRVEGDLLVLALIRTGTRAELFRKEGVNPMKKSTSLRMLLRSPVKTAVTLLLIAAASFLFLYNLLDYAMTRRNYDSTYGSYHGYFSLMRPEDRQVGNNLSDELARVGYFFVSDPAADPAYTGVYRYEDAHMAALAAGDLEAIEGLPYVTKAEKRYMTGGIVDFERKWTYDSLTIVKFYLHTKRVVFTATVDTVLPNLRGYSYLGQAGTDMGLKLKDVEVLAGAGEDLKQNRGYIDKKRLVVSVPVVYPEKANGHIVTNGLYAKVSLFTGNYLTPADMEALEPGQRYVFIASIDPYPINSHGISEEDSMLDWPYVFLGDDAAYGVCSIVTPLEGEPENWLETEKFAGLRQMMEIIDTDARTLDVHYLEDMQTLRRFQEGKLVVVQGRPLAAEDTEKRNPVCLIPEIMAETNHLQVGDTLHLELGDKLLEQYAPWGAVAYSPLRYAENWTGQDFTIVGTYTESGLERLSNEDQFWAYGVNSVMVPLSFLPETADRANHEFKPAEVSFVVGDADSILPFRDEILPKLEDMGYYVYFFDGGWPAVRDTLRQAGSLSLVKLAAFAVSALLVLLLTVYLYILRKKREYAVMRALGCPSRQARSALLFPLLTLAVPAILLGTLGAAVYAHAAAERNAAEFALLGLSMDTSVPPGMVLAGFGGSLLLLLVLAWAALVRVAKTPPLELLQGSGLRKAPVKQSALPPEPAEVPAYAALPELPEPVYRSRTALGHTLRYVGRHLARTPVKSLLAILLALVLAFSMGFFTLLRSTYRDLYRNIELHPRFLNGFSYNKALQAEKSGYVREPFYQYTRQECESNFVQDTLILTNDISRVCAAEITWREDKGPKMFTESSAFCVVTRDLAEALGMGIGDRVDFCRPGKLGLLAGTYQGASYDELVEIYHKYNGKLTIAGIAETEGMTAYGPIAAWQHLQNLFADYVPLDLAEYTLNDYHEAMVFRSWAWRLIYGTRTDFSLDTAEADRVYQTYRLLELLYPIAFALALILGGVLPAGVILQSAREASLLRVLGTTKRRTRAMLSLEQAVLCLFGLLCAAAGLIGLKGDALRPVSGLLGLYAGSHFALCILGTLLAAVSVTRRNVLDLLQTKE